MRSSTLGGFAPLRWNCLSVWLLSAALALSIGCSSVPAEKALPDPIPGSTGSQLLESLTTYNFPITTSSKEAQAWFNQGLVLLYGFNHGEAIRSFTEAAALDPHAAMPWWGIAYANGMHINVPQMTEEQWKASREAALRAIAELDNESELEKALVHAVAARTAWPVPPEQRPYDEAFAAAMEDAHKQYPDNPDVTSQFAESLMNLQPWDYWTSDGDPKFRTAEFVGALEQSLAQYPDHPQVAHLYIHAMEAGPHPERAEAAADRLRARVPGAGHLVHMPSHLYARVGRYADAVTANEDALEADAEFFSVGTNPGVYYVYHAHNLHFLCFASMMEGRYEPALESARKLEKAIPDPVLDEFAFLIEGIVPSKYHAMIRFGKWEQILEEEAPGENRPLCLAIHYYARGIAQAATGHIDEARLEQVRFQAQVKKVPQDWWIFSNKAHDVIPIAHQMLEGEIAYREGRFDDAWAALAKGVEYEDQLVYDEPPGWMIPVRHAMGALLMEQGEHEWAERLYREDQKDHPGNGWSLLGLKLALEAQDKDDEAAMIDAKLAKAWKRVNEKPTSSCLCAPGQS
ncbi:hypothetical protein KQI84_09985 [bacterium]|nr:hypothetical protein [bacterium]